MRVPGNVPRKVNRVRLVVATHNLMHGLRLPGLITHHVAVRDEQGLDLLCLQENRFLTEEADLPSDRIAAALGPDYRVVRDDGCPGLAFVHDARTLVCEAHAIAPLPLLAKLTPFERLYIRGGKTKQKYVLLAEMSARRRRPGRPVRGRLFPPGHGGRQRAPGCAGRGDRGGAARPRPATRVRRVRRQQRVRLVAAAGGAAATARPAGGAGRDRSRNPPDALLRPAERGQVHSRHGRAAGQTGPRHPSALRRRLQQPAGRRPRSGRDPGLRPRSRVGPDRDRVRSRRALLAAYHRGRFGTL